MEKLDLVSDLLIWPIQNGVQLIAPEGKKNNNLLNLKALYQLPLSIFFLNVDGSQYESVNDFHFQSVIGETSHLSCAKDLNGKSVAAVHSKESELLIRNSRVVSAYKKVSLFEEGTIRSDGSEYLGYTFKFPCYDRNHQVNGILGVTISVAKGPKNQLSLVESLNLVIASGLFSSQTSIAYMNNFILPNKIAGVHLSQQQLKCLRLLVRGKTAKMIAQELGISPRTVESYCEQIKLKFNVSSKSELIDKTISHFFDRHFLYQNDCQL